MLERAWRANLGAGSNNRVKIAAPPVISNGSLYFLDADHRVHAIDARDGHRLWNERLRPNEGRDRVARGGGVAAGGGRLYVSTGFGFIVALDAGNGNEIWRAQASAPFQSAPTVSGDRVYAVTNDSELMAFDAATGEVSWTYQAIAEPARILSAPSVGVDGETVVAPFASGEVVALLAANGRRLWSDSLSRAGRMNSLSAINDIAGPSGDRWRRGLCGQPFGHFGRDRSAQRSTHLGAYVCVHANAVGRGRCALRRQRRWRTCGVRSPHRQHLSGSSNCAAIAMRVSARAASLGQARS